MQVEKVDESTVTDLKQNNKPEDTNMLLQAQGQ